MWTYWMLNAMRVISVTDYFVRNMQFQIKKSKLYAWLKYVIKYVWR